VNEPIPLLAISGMIRYGHVVISRSLLWEGFTVVPLYTAACQMRLPRNDRPEGHCTKGGGKNKIPASGDPGFVLPRRSATTAGAFFFAFLHIFLDYLPFLLYPRIAKYKRPELLRRIPGLFLFFTKVLKPFPLYIRSYSGTSRSATRSMAASAVTGEEIPPRYPLEVCFKTKVQEEL